MNNAIAFPLPVPRIPPSVRVLNRRFIERLTLVNAVTRQLRDWNVGVVAAVISDGEDAPVLSLCVDPDAPGVRLDRLLAATRGKRLWLAGTDSAPPRITAVLNGVTLFWNLRERGAT
ncbi:MAG: hypothetical protein LBF61_06955 [Azoarcus sp.]|jgi:hypothetical protein|nr:hypothetical protein [Azoarcus sp.]